MSTTAIIVELIAGSIFLTMGDLVFKDEIKHLTWGWYAIGLGLYLIGLVFLVRTYAYENIAIASAMLVIFNIVTLTIVSWIWFKEPITLVQAGGLLLSFGAIALLHP
jgi:multidrug transporter EmrE-like cation transporter